MRLGAQGLTHLPTRDLERLLRLVHRGELTCPIDQPALATVGLLRMVDMLGHLRGLDAKAVQAVLVAVLAERR